MNSTPPIAFFSISFVFGAVCPIYWPTRSSRVTLMTWPRRTKPRRWRMSAILSATVVLPVPGLPVNDMCRVGYVLASDILWRMRSTSRSEAISRIRVFTGTRPINSRSSCARIEAISTASNSHLRSTEVTGASRALSCALGTACSVECAMITDPVDLRRFVALALRAIGCIGARRVADVAPNRLLAVEPEARLDLRPVDDEGEAHRLPTVRGVEAGDTDVAIAIDPPAVGEFLHDARGVAQVEHRQAPHLPIGVAGMGIVGELKVDRPALVETILDLAPDLLVGEIGKEREAALGYAHDLDLSDGEASNGKTSNSETSNSEP